MIEECVNLPEPTNVALLINSLYSNEFRCLSIKKKQWQVYKDDKWIDIEEGYLLYNRISKDILNLFEVYLINLEEKNLELRKDILENENMDLKELQESNLRKISNCRKLCKLLKNTTFKNKVMKEAAMLLYVTLC